MKTITVNDKQYEVVDDKDKCLDVELLNQKVTDYFDDYDYIFGDYSAEALRLKGFNESTNKKVNKINDIKTLEDYIKNYCNIGAKTFLIKKVK